MPGGMRCWHLPVSLIVPRLTGNFHFATYVSQLDVVNETILMFSGNSPQDHSASVRL